MFYLCPFGTIPFRRHVGGRNICGKVAATVCQTDQLFQTRLLLSLLGDVLDFVKEIDSTLEAY
jgi:hypothetical protein